MKKPHLPEIFAHNKCLSFAVHTCFLELLRQLYKLFFGWLDVCYVITLIPVAQIMIRWDMSRTCLTKWIAILLARHIYHIAGQKISLMIAVKEIIWVTVDRCAIEEHWGWNYFSTDSTTAVLKFLNRINQSNLYILIKTLLKFTHH